MHHFCVDVCAHTCKHTPFISLGRNTIIRNISFFHCLCGSYLDFKLVKTGREMGRERVSLFSVYPHQERRGKLLTAFQS